MGRAMWGKRGPGERESSLSRVRRQVDVLAARQEADLDLWTGEPLTPADLADKRSNTWAQRKDRVDTTFGRGSDRVNVISGDGAKGGASTVASFDRTDSAAALSAFMAGRGKPVPDAPASAPTPASPGYAPADGYGLPAVGTPVYKGKQAGVVAGYGTWHDTAPPISFDKPTPATPASFRPGTEKQVKATPPARAGRAIELD